MKIVPGKFIGAFAALALAVGVSAESVTINIDETTGFGSQDTLDGSVVVSSNSLTITGNRWVATSDTYTITADTKLEFEFMSSARGEIHGIGLDEDNLASPTRIFQLYGTQAYAITSQGTYVTPGQYQVFQIPIGQYFTGNNMRVVFVNDKDSGVKNNTSYYRNLRLVTPGNDYPEVIGNCSLNEVELALINAHNQARIQGRSCGSNWYNAAAKLRWDCRLGQASYTHSNDMATNNFFSHTGSDGSSPFERMRRAGYIYRTAGENIAAGQRTVDAVMSGWLSSPGHCSNIMNPNFQDMGAAKVESSSSTYRVYWTAGFGRSQ